jgi:hypothetical protein
MANQPAVRLDYQPWAQLRGTFKYSGWAQKDQAILGTIPGWSDTRQYNPFVRTIAVAVNYSITPTTFLEGTWGLAQNSLTGCALAQGGTGPSFCRAAFPMNDNASLAGAGLSALPFLFPDAGVIDPSYFAYEALNGVNPPIWDGKRISMVPNLAWGNRIGNAPQNVPFPGYLNVNRTNDLAISLTKVTGRHTLKSGFYRTYSLKSQQRQGWQGTITFAQRHVQPLDTTFGYANARRWSLLELHPELEIHQRNFVYDLEAYIPGQLEDDKPPDVRLRHAVRASGAAVRQAWAGVELPPRQMGRATRRTSTWRAAGTRSLPVLGLEPTGDGPAHGRLARPEHGRRDPARSSPTRGTRSTASSPPVKASRRPPTSGRRSPSGPAWAPPTT